MIVVALVLAGGGVGILVSLVVQAERDPRVATASWRQRRAWRRERAALACRR